MAGFTIHMAIGKRYIEKHKLEIKNEEEFIKGVIAPDLNEEMTETSKDKSKTHYGKWGNYYADTNINQFLKDPKVEIAQDYWKGYFLHLLTDYYFYHQYFNKELEKVREANDNFYFDYDCLNTVLIEKYQVERRENIKKYMKCIEAEPKYLKVNRVIDFIEDISNMKLEEKRKIIERKGMEGLQ